MRTLLFMLGGSLCVCLGFIAPAIAERIRRGGKP